MATTAPMLHAITELGTVSSSGVLCLEGSDVSEYPTYRRTVISWEISASAVETC